MNALEAGHFVFNIRHLPGDDCDACSAIDRLAASSTQDFADFSKGKAHALRMLDELQILQRLRRVDTVVVGSP